MPCLIQTHHHQPWPATGEHCLVIESCETHCGWCQHKEIRKGAANNLRKHAQRHIAHDDLLRGITIRSGRAGRPRVSRVPEPLPPRPEPLVSGTQQSRRSETPPRERLQTPSKGDEGQRSSYSDLLSERNALQTRVLLLEGLLLKNGITVPAEDAPASSPFQPVQHLTQFANRLHEQSEELQTRSASFQNLHERHEVSINAILTFLATIYNRSGEMNHEFTFDDMEPRSFTGLSGRSRIRDQESRSSAPLSTRSRTTSRATSADTREMSPLEDLDDSRSPSPFPDDVFHNTQEQLNLLQQLSNEQSSRVRDLLGRLQPF